MDRLVEIDIFSELCLISRSGGCNPAKGMQATQPEPSSSGTPHSLPRDEAEFAVIVRRHLPLVLAVARRRLGNSGHAEDAAQQVFLALSRKLAQCREIPCLGAWLQRAAVYEAANIARRESRHRRRLDEAAKIWPDPRPAAGNPELDAALAALPERDREILLLHHYERLPFATVAQRLGMTEAAAQRRGHRALGKLAQRIRPAAGPDACAMWLAGSLVPAGNPPAELVERISVLKTAAQPLSWLAISAAAVALSGGIWVVVAVTRPGHPPTPVAASAPTRHERMKPVRPAPHVADDKLDDDIRKFISLAKVNPDAAWKWAKQRPESAVEFLRNGTVRALADRDLAAADRFLDAVSGSDPRRVVLTGIFESRGAENFDSALMWLDSVAESRDLLSVSLNSCSYINSEYRDLDYAGALGFVRSAKIRDWLIRQACEKAAELDESRIEILAAGLSGHERQIALSHAASLLLQRGEPRGWKLLEEMGNSLEEVPELGEIALRDPGLLLDRLGDQAVSRAGEIWRQWSLRDAPAAVEWARAQSESRRRGLGIDRVTDGLVERLLKQP